MCSNAYSTHTRNACGLYGFGCVWGWIFATESSHNSRSSSFRIYTHHPRRYLAMHRIFHNPAGTAYFPLGLLRECGECINYALRMSFSASGGNAAGQIFGGECNPNVNVAHHTRGFRTILLVAAIYLFSIKHMLRCASMRIHFVESGLATRNRLLCSAPITLPLITVGCRHIITLVHMLNVDDDGLCLWHMLFVIFC